MGRRQDPGGEGEEDREGGGGHLHVVHGADGLHLDVQRIFVAGHDVAEQRIALRIVPAHGLHGYLGQLHHLVVPQFAAAHGLCHGLDRVLPAHLLKVT